MIFRSSDDPLERERRCAPSREILAKKLPSETRPSRSTRAWTDDGNSGLVTYSVTPPPAPSPNEKRREQRRRTRLRAGKILDRANRFIVEATIVERSCAGLRLRLAREIDLPEIFHFYDEESEGVFVARIAWRRQSTLGVRRGPGIAVTARQLIALRGKFYAIRD
jgi:hypothetical protein